MPRSIVRMATETLRHIRFAGRTAFGMRPSRLGAEVIRRAHVAMLDVRSPIPAVTLEDLLGGPQAPRPDDAVTLHPGILGRGGPNAFETLLLAMLVKAVQPSVILELGTFRGGTTWHLFHNAGPEALLYTLDLPPGRVPPGTTDAEMAANTCRDLLPRSSRVKLLLHDTREWDGTLENKVQFAFIDANHTYQGVRNDSEKVMGLLDEIACVCWHDCFGRDYGYGVHRYLTELVARGHQIFRVRGRHEVSSLAIWMSPACRDRVGSKMPGARSPI